MKNKWKAFSSLFQLIVGILAVVVFVILGFGDENMTKWIVTLILAVAYIVFGIVGIVDYYKSDK